MPEQPVVPETEPVASWAGEQPAPTRSYLPWSRHPPDTPQAVSIIGFALGCLFLFGVNQALDLDSWAGRTEQGLWSALRSAPLGAYWACLAIFHMSEYLTTAIYNPAKVHVGSYLLHNGMQYHMAHLAGMIEYVLEEAYLPASYRAWKHSSFFIALGLLLVAGGQYLRSQAMITAASNFSHDVAFVKADQHVLVTRGVYQYSRHPSYAAFFYWAVGTQVLCGNPICAVAFAGIVYRFFSQRIYWEEKALVSFFGQDYVNYRQRVGTGIPFVR